MSGERITPRVFGVDVDAETRCAHYHGATDIIAIRFKCCDRWYPCHECHRALADHEPQVWPREGFDVPAVLCGACSYQMTVREYLHCDAKCPSCARSFNPNCAKHYALYFAAD